MTNETPNPTQSSAGQGAAGANSAHAEVPQVADETSSPAYTPEEIAQLEQSAASAQEYLDMLLRTRAEFENYRKRMQKETQQNIRYANEGLLLDVLTLVDGFEMALQSCDRLNAGQTAQPEIKGLADGIRLTYRLLQDFLARNAVQRIAGKGTRFDPRVHEAVDMTPVAGQQDETVIEEFQTGYMIGDRVLRPSRVKIAVPAGHEDEPPPAPPDAPATQDPEA